MSNWNSCRQLMLNVFLFGTPIPPVKKCIKMAKISTCVNENFRVYRWIENKILPTVHFFKSEIGLWEAEKMKCSNVDGLTIFLLNFFIGTWYSFVSNILSEYIFEHRKCHNYRSDAVDALKINLKKIHCFKQVHFTS